jgi:hypothetical protein
MENTRTSKDQQDYFSRNPDVLNRLRGVPVGLLCRSRDVRAEIGVSAETWALWRAAGLVTVKIGSEAELILTDELHKFARSKPQLGERPSVARKRRMATRKKGSAQ